MTNYKELRSMAPLTNDQLMTVAPSIFATKPWHEMSEKYTFISTIQMLDKMRSEGFQPFYVAQSKTRIPGKESFTKHLLRFRKFDYQTVLGTIPEIVLVTSHDGLCVWKMLAGLFRLVCMNGAVMGDTFKQVNVRHSGSADGIVEASYEIVDQFPQVMAQVEDWSHLRLTAPQQEAFGTAALQLRYDDNASPITAAKVVTPRRTEDKDPTLWNTFNVVQENLVHGGLRGQNQDTGRRTRSRAVTAIGENTRLNKALWSLTEAMAKLVS